MPLQQLVEYFNDRLELEHKNGVRTFVLQDGVVHGLYGPIRIGSSLSPIRDGLQPTQFIGHHAQLKVSPNPDRHRLSGLELDHLRISSSQQPAAFDSVISFDRLSRTVHMLNYLPQSHLDKRLFLDVDPRHILGIKADHGAYFEEIIVKCGLETGNVTIGLTVNSIYARLYPVLLKGLENYQRRGYRLMLKFDLPAVDKSAAELIARVSPDFVGLSAQNIDQARDGDVLMKLQALTGMAATVNAKSILFDIEDERSADLARQSGFELLHGEFFEQPGQAAGQRTNKGFDVQWYENVRG
ncbi:MAG: hypothetical protein PHW13_11755 [Methylococcales bacterium]|nr:hypothetical protein [Methylococcales bacterium]